ncbi:MAG TPA: erythromycin esterase family protein, partial [Gemmatimonadales bacterium]|nr:erythromycin esterase family protein [Gemmatimonadales bacterium]
RAVLDALRREAHPLTGDRRDYDSLMALIGDARIVLLGEASHGTHEFYRERARITQRLIEEEGFAAVAVEADWPDAYRVNRWVRGESVDRTALDALGGFERFPRWMWRNGDVLAFISWLHRYNESLPKEKRVGFYGLDLYSLFASMEEVIRFLEQADPEAAARARYRYGCFDAFAEDTQAYGYAAEFGITRSCEDQAVQQLIELQRRAAQLARRDGGVSDDDLFYAEQNARLVKNAEQYYRTMFRGRVSSWNLRDRHMAETLEELIAHLERKWPRARVVVWEHNSHIGDARATTMGEMGEWNVGQLARERFGGRAILVGFTTYQGTVTAASDWEAPAERKRVRPGLPGSFEALFHTVGIADFILPLKGEPRLREALGDPRLERAIGVIYRPESERVSHYFEARLPQQFDAVIHFDETRAVEPLDRTPGWDKGEPPDTFPFGV